MRVRHATREAQSGANGEYIFVEVPVGSYELDVTIQGFKKYSRKGIVLNLNEVVSVDIALQVGGATETVEVTGAPPVVDTSSTQLGAVVNERSSTQLPLNQRDVYQLLQLQPGVQSQLGNDPFLWIGQSWRRHRQRWSRAFEQLLRERRRRQRSLRQPACREPSPDSIEEFKVISNAFDAEYGRNSGAVVNVITQVRHERNPWRLLRVLPQRPSEHSSLHIHSISQAGFQTKSVWRHSRRADQKRQNLFLCFL